MDLFDLEAVDLLSLRKVIVGHDRTVAGEGWFLDQVIIRESTEAKKKYIFRCDR